ncbi:MAG: carboxypeptidase regulatory-like domain-containing protein [Flavobacteriales bacterium]
MSTRFSSLFIILLFFSASVFAQKIKVKGVIKDSIGDPLELATVIASVKETNATEAYSITNYEGRFQMNLPVNVTYILRASFLGFQTVEKELTLSPKSKDMQLDFVLKPKADALDGVEIVYEMPVTVKGDTIVYNADSFTDGNEKKLGDVLKKLPGVEVNDEGEIEVEGKTVNKVMVEGKDFFDGDSKLATKNIPADAVDKVQVLRNYNEVDQMRGLGNDQDNIAVNIKLKEGKKNFWFGEVTAGVGVADKEERYLIHPKLFYYNPKYSLNVITDFNNIGEVPFTWRDYFKFTGGFKNFNRGGGTNFSVSQNDLGFALTQNNKANELESKFVAANFSWEASKALDISGFAILSDNTTNLVTKSIRKFIQTNTTETTNSNSNQESKLGMLKLSSVYKPNTNFQLDYDALLKLSDQSEDIQTLSIFENINNNVTEQKESTPTSINQNLNVYYTLNDKNIFAGQVQHLWQDEDPFYKAITDIAPFVGILPLDQNQNKFNLNQEKNIKTNKIDAKIDYYYVINNKSNINFTLGSTLSNQKFNSGIFQVLDNQNEVNFTDSNFNNDVQFNFTDAFFGLHYKFILGKFTFTPGLTLHNYTLKNEQLNTNSTQNDLVLLPDFNAILNLKKSESLRLNYTISSEYTDVTNYAEAFVFNNYNNMFRGNRNLENALQHNYNLTYFSFNLFNYTNVSGSLNYTRKIDAIKNNTTIVAINQVSRPENIASNFADETFSVFGRFSKRVKKLQFRLNANVLYSNFHNIVNTEITKSTSFTQNYKVSVGSNFKDWPNFEIGYSKIINDYDNGGISQTYFTDKPFVNIDVNFLKYFTLSADWNYYNYTNDQKTITNEYSFLDANLYFQQGDSPWEFKLQASNILDTSFLNNDSFNEQFNSTSQYFVLPRIIMLVVKYNL